MLFHAVLGAKVYLAEHKATTIARKLEKYHFFSTEGSLEYVPFCDDFGPMNLYTARRFCDALDQKLSEYADHTLVYCVENTPRAITNAAFLLGSYMVINMHLCPQAVWSCFEDISGRMELYRDATYEEPDFQLSLIDCWDGLAKADSIGWMGMYDMEEYLHYDSPLEGDLHELIPGKIIALRGPHSLPDNGIYLDQNGSRVFSPTFYLDAFGDMGVTTVVRLNEPEYDSADFTSHGIKLVDLQFDDCSAPPAKIVAAFLELMQDASGAVAVHCKAGLGRTGTLAAAYLMAAHGFTAREAIGWLRVVRPGSVIGEQQRFLCELERLLCREAADRDRPAPPATPPPEQDRARLAAPAAFEPIPEDSAVAFDGGGGACGAAARRRETAARQVAAAAASGSRVQAKLREREAWGAAEEDLRLSEIVGPA